MKKHAAGGQGGCAGAALTQRACRPSPERERGLHVVGRADLDRRRVVGERSCRLLGHVAVSIADADALALLSDTSGLDIDGSLRHLTRNKIQIMRDVLSGLGLAGYDSPGRPMRSGERNSSVSPAAGRCWSWPQRGQHSCPAGSIPACPVLGVKNYDWKK